MTARRKTNAKQAEWAQRLAEGSLFYKFLQRRINSFPMPRRRGTPKGQRIGFPREKYVATVYACYHLDLRYVAKRIGISYGVLRKWRTEEGFSQAVRDHVTAFTQEALLPFLRAGSAKATAEVKRSLAELTFAQIAAGPLPQPHVPYDAPELHDARFWDESVCNVLEEFVVARPPLAWLSSDDNWYLIEMLAHTGKRLQNWETRLPALRYITDAVIELLGDPEASEIQRKSYAVMLRAVADAMLEGTKWQRK